MDKKFRRSLLAVAGLAAMVAFGCGGSNATTTSSSSGDGGSDSGGSNVPTAKTKSDVRQNVAAYGASAANSSFAGYGPKLHALGGKFFDASLGLYATIHISPSGTSENLFTDEARTLPAGNLLYKINEVALTYSGPITVSDGRYAGLSGVYFEAIQPDGFNGSVNYSTADGGTVVSAFAVKNDDLGKIFGTATIGVALPGDYTQNQQVVYNADGTSTVTTLDSFSCRLALNIAANASGTGQITGTDPGLPATMTFTADGSGSVTFANGSKLTFADWKLAE